MLRTRLAFGLTLLAFLVILVGCLEDTIENEIVTPYPGGTIYGRVTPVVPQTEVSAWQATKVKSTIVDAEGYFSLSDLSPGLYRVVVATPGGLSRTISDVAVDRTRSVSLGTVELIHLPSPLLALIPGDASTGVRLSDSFYLTSGARLDVSSLATAVRLDPAVQGTWGEEYYGGTTYYYELHRNAPWIPSTLYRVHIGEDMRLSSGATWGSTLDYSFETEPFGIQFVSWSYYLSGESVPPLFSGLLVNLRFNAPLDAATVAGALHVAPAIPFSASLEPNNEIKVNITGGLSPDTRYLLTIDANLSDTHGNRLADTDSVTFVTDPFRVNAATFSGGQFGSPIPPGGEINATVILNSRVDIDAFNLAAEFDPVIPGFWLVSQVQEGYYNPGATLLFFPTGPGLLPEQEYEFRIDGAADLGGGFSLGRDYTSSFVVQPVMITGANPANGQRNVYRYNSITVSFNTPMQQVSTEAAFSLQQYENGVPVSGTFSWYSDSRAFEFRTNGLAANTTYQFSVSEAAQSQLGPTLKAPLSSVFRTQSQ